MFLTLLGIAVSFAALRWKQHWGLGILDLHHDSQSSVSDLPPFFDDKSVPSVSRDTTVDVRR